MLAERIYRLVVSVTFLTLLYKILLQEDCNFLHVMLGGNMDVPLYYTNYPCLKIPNYLDDFYIFKLSYHLYELVYTLVFQRSRSDFPEYLLHHLMTWSLIFFSYSLNMLPLGCIVMLVHDATDLMVTLFKLTIDVTHISVQFIFYSSMLVSWVYFRLWFFPIHLIWGLHWECYEDNICQNVNYPMLNMLFAFICGLFLLHIFWFFLMVQGLFRRTASKTGFKDSVSLSNSENRSENKTKELID